MEDRKQMIHEFMQDDKYIPMNINDIIKILDVSEDEKQELLDILIALEEEGKILKTNKNKYATVEKLGYISGKYRANEKGFGFITLNDEEPDVFVSKEHSNNALNGDTVVAQVIRKQSEGKKAEAKVISIAKRNNNRIIGTFECTKNFGFVSPDNNRIVKDIFISRKSFGKAKDGDKVVVEILKWGDNDKKPEGEIVEVLGDSNDPKIDYISIINMYNIEEKFPDEVIQEAKNTNQVIDESNFKHRRDLRNETIITIDGIDTKDIDDAIHVKKINENTYELGVHIADVSHYVKEGSALNEEAIKRGTSVYLINKVVPMLPRELSNGICSLNENEDRFALSINIKIDKSGKTLSSDIYKSIIRSRKKCNYTDISNIINKTDDAKYVEHSELLEMIENMTELMTALKSKRAKRGAIEFDLYESKIKLDENDKAIDIGKRSRGIADQVIEEFMLAANETIAETFYHLNAPFIYRIHDLPEQDRLEQLNKILFNYGMKIKGINNEVHPKALQEVLDGIKDKENGKLISNLILRTLQLAKYSEQNEGHFGLAAQYYCHFTSPIRRYPDLFIHRVISKYIESGYNLNSEVESRFFDQAKEYSKRSSDMERNAERAERDFEDIKKCEYMQDKIGQEYEGTIASLTSFGMFVELDNTIEGLIRYENMKDDYYIFNEETMCIIGERTKKKYLIGGKINVRVVNANKQQKRIDFEIV